MTTKTKTESKITVRARAFRGSNGGVGVLDTYRFAVESDGTVRIYDATAGHYTLHHGMSAREESRVRSEAYLHAACDDCGTTGHTTGSNTCPGEPRER